ncbi:hypothetical protein BH24CHL6_BH24CHL6_05320 [soil metagenome]
MRGMNIPLRSHLLASGALVSALLLAGCGPTGAPAWTFAPLGPTQPPAESPAPGGSPAPGETPGGSVTLNVVTTQENPLAFEPDRLEAPPATDITVVYLNDSNVTHNIHFFAGPDRSAPSLAATELATGPGAEEQISFTTPDEAGDYFFVCDVHPEMTGTLTLAE